MRILVACSQRVNQFHDAGFKQYRQDQNQFGGGFVLFVNDENIPWKSFNAHPKFSDLELMVFELHQSKQRWLFLGLCKPPFQNDVEFLNTANSVLDDYSSTNANII